jgi:hypothetical protein
MQCEQSMRSPANVCGCMAVEVYAGCAGAGSWVVGYDLCCFVVACSHGVCANRWVGVRISVLD